MHAIVETINSAQPAHPPHSLRPFSVTMANPPSMGAQVSSETSSAQARATDGRTCRAHGPARRSLRKHRGWFNSSLSIAFELGIESAQHQSQSTYARWPSEASERRFLHIWTQTHVAGMRVQICDCVGCRCRQMKVIALKSSTRAASCLNRMPNAKDTKYSYAYTLPPIQAYIPYTYSIGHLSMQDLPIAVLERE